MMILVGIGGKAGAGKDTIASFLVERYGFVRLGFADALKAEVRACFRRTLLAYAAEKKQYVDLSPDDALGRLLAEKPPVVRALLQEHGTEIRRAGNPNYWIDEWRRRLVRLEASRVVVPDVRFENEVRAIHVFPGGTVVRVDRPIGPVIATPDHVSEALGEDGRWDAVFVNDGTIAQLLELVVVWAAGQRWPS